MQGLLLTILLAPMVGFVIQFFWGRKLPRQGDWLTIVAIGISLLCSLIVFGQTMGGATYNASWDWLDIGGQAGPLSIGFKVDGLTGIMLVVVSLVAFLVHVFSVGYMKGDPKYWAFFAWLQMFSVSMLILVVAGNLLHLFMGWELVGLCSYKLIGFWSEKKDPANAARKAFITTRIGDLGMLVAILAIWQTVGSFEFDAIFKAVADGNFAGPLLAAAGFGVFVAAIGKSAQMPLHVWLPDAMEGPTPVSALIHAATMVAAGVYLVGRMMPIMLPEVMIVIATVGAATAVMAGFVAVAQNDIKKVLAYSTCSQLGYMFLGLGVGAWHAALFHLTTHAFFKALMFLGSGSVIHGCHHEQDMRKMGGLLRKMPVTGITFGMGVLAIAGLPFLSGFYSKDAILAGAFNRYPVLFWLGLGAAFLTAFYMMRLYVMTFLGKPKDEHIHEHAHESPRSMTVPLVVLAVLAVIAGWSFGAWHEEILGPKSNEVINEKGLTAAGVAVYDVETDHSGEHFHKEDKGLLALVILAGIGGLGLGYLVFAKMGAGAIAGLKRPVRWLETACENKFWFDEFYREAVLRPTYGLAKACNVVDRQGVDGLVNWVGRTTRGTFAHLSGVYDKRVVDGLVNGVASFCQGCGAIISFLQGGRIRAYLAMSAVTVVLVLIAREIF